MAKDKVSELIEKYRIRLVEKDGQDFIQACKKPTAKDITQLKERKTEIIAELKRREAGRAAKEAAEKAAKEAEKAELMASRKTIKVRWYDGEILGGYTPNGLMEEKVLEDLGVARYVRGWGVKVDQDMVKAIGTEFTVADIEAYLAPAKAEKEKKAAVAEKALAEKFSQAKATGLPVAIHSYSVPCNDPNEECSLDIVTEYAMPDGSRETTRTHTW